VNIKENIKKFILEDAKFKNPHKNKAYIGFIITNISIINKLSTILSNLLLLILGNSITF
jgi:hypothetical protein